MHAENSQFIGSELLQQSLKQSKLNLFKTEGCEMFLIMYGGLLANDPLLM